LTPASETIGRKFKVAVLSGLGATPINALTAICKLPDPLTFFITIKVAPSNDHVVMADFAHDFVVGLKIYVPKSFVAL
jgi:hypothetical protein